MNRNEQRLLILLLGALLVWGGLQFLPDGEQSTDSERDLQDSLDTARHQLAVLDSQAKVSSTRLQHTLTADIPQATHLCQIWLLQLTKTCGLTEVTITPFPVQQAVQDLQILPLTVTCSGQQSQGAEMLQRLAASPVEHRLRRWQWMPADAETIQLTVELEVLCSPVGQSTEILIPQDIEQESEWGLIAAKLPLEVEPPPPQTPPRNPRNPAAAASPPVQRRWKLVGIIDQSSRPEAWFVDAATQQKLKLSLGAAMETASGSIVVDHIDGQGITLRNGTQTQFLRPGETLVVALAKSP